MDYLPLFEPQLPVPSSDIRQSLKRELVIMHPGYTPQLRLLTLRASDYGSLEYGILYYACCIVAGNVWKPDEGRNGLNTGPFFSKDRLGQDKLILPESNRYLIPAGRYYFHVPGFTISRATSLPYFRLHNTNFTSQRNPTRSSPVSVIGSPRPHCLSHGKAYELNLLRRRTLFLMLRAATTHPFRLLTLTASSLITSGT